MRLRDSLRLFLAIALVAVTAIAVVAVSGGSGEQPPRPNVDRFDEEAAFAFLKRQVTLGPRAAGSRASRRLAELLRARVPHGRYQPVPGGLRNVVGRIPGRDPTRFVVLGAHYDTKDLPGFLGANDGASGTAVVLELSRTIRPRTIRPTLVIVFFDGEEAPGASNDVAGQGLRGSKVAARIFAEAEAMVLLDFVGDGELALPREGASDKQLWARLRRAAQRVGVGSVFPDRTRRPILDDHFPFFEFGVPAIDLIDFEFDCYHRRCDNLSAVSVRSLDAVGEAVLELLHNY